MRKNCIIVTAIGAVSFATGYLLSFINHKRHTSSERVFEGTVVEKTECTGGHVLVITADDETYRIPVTFIYFDEVSVGDVIPVVVRITPGSIRTAEAVRDHSEDV